MAMKRMGVRPRAKSSESQSKFQKRAGVRPKSGHGLGGGGIRPETDQGRAPPKGGSGVPELPKGKGQTQK